MHIATTQRCPAAINWTIESKLRDRKATRDKWTEDFEANYKEVADKISESITNELLVRLSESLLDPYKLIPKSGNHLKFCIRLDISNVKNCKHIKEWAQDAAELPPFKQWFEKWEDSQETSWEDRQEASLEDALSQKVLQQSEMESKREYFLELFAKVGLMVKKDVIKNLSCFVNKPQNNYLSYTVTWYRKDDKYFANPNDNCLLVELWISK